MQYVYDIDIAIILCSYIAGVVHVHVCTHVYTYMYMYTVHIDCTSVLYMK